MVKNILVTGGAGFVGSHLVDRLMEQGHFVWCVDNLYTGTMQNIEHWLDNERFTFIKHNIIDPLQIETKFDEIYNLACPASPVHYQEDPIATFKTSIFGALNMLEIAKQTGAKILQASTSEVYGDPLVHPQMENYWGNVNPIGIRSCYDEGKRGAETLFFDYARSHQVRIKIIRIFNTYGPRMHPQDGRVVSNFIVQALQQQDLTIYGEGNQTRSFCYVDDLVNGILKMMDSDDSVQGPINLGNPNEFTIRELADKVLTMIRTSSKMSFCPLPADDPKVRQPDIDLARKVLNWEPKVQLEAGLNHTITYFTKLLGIGELGQ